MSPGVGNELVKVYPVQTFLSCLLSDNSDCVVQIIPRLNKNTGKSLPPEIRRAILETVPKWRLTVGRKYPFLSATRKRRRRPSSGSKHKVPMSWPES